MEHENTNKGKGSKPEGTLPVAASQPDIPTYQEARSDRQNGEKQDDYRKGHVYGNLSSITHRLAPWPEKPEEDGMSLPSCSFNVQSALAGIVGRKGPSSATITCSWRGQGRLRWHGAPEALCRKYTEARLEQAFIRCIRDE